MNPPETAKNVTPERETTASTPEPVAPTGGASARRRGETTSAARRVVLSDLHAYYGSTHAVKGVDLEFEPGKVTAMIGPSGCGKSTLVRCINRMHEEIPGARAEGQVRLDDLDVYDEAVDV